MKQCERRWESVRKRGCWKDEEAPGQMRRGGPKPEAAPVDEEVMYGVLYLIGYYRALD